VRSFGYTNYVNEGKASRVLCGRIPLVMASRSARRVSTPLGFNKCMSGIPFPRSRPSEFHFLKDQAPSYHTSLSLLSTISLTNVKKRLHFIVNQEERLSFLVTKPRGKRRWLCILGMKSRGASAHCVTYASARFHERSRRVTFLLHSCEQQIHQVPC
jgi:hypothetical protein